VRARRCATLAVSSTKSGSGSLTVQGVKAGLEAGLEAGGQSATRAAPVQFRDATLLETLMLRCKKSNAPGAVAKRDLKRYYALLAAVELPFSELELTQLAAVLEPSLLLQTPLPENLRTAVLALGALEIAALTDMLERRSLALRDG